MSEDSLFVLKREAAKQPFSFDVDGTTVSVPHMSDVDQFELADLIESKAGDLSFIVAFFRSVMEPEQFEALQTAKPSRPMINMLWDAYQKHCGLKEGESKASAG